MSTITSDWTPSATESPWAHSAKAGNKYRREEEFRSALDKYIADYQKHLAATTGNSGFRTRHAFFQRFVELLRG
jgi:hypothetical protein